MDSIKHATKKAVHRVDEALDSGKHHTTHHTTGGHDATKAKHKVEEAAKKTEHRLDEKAQKVGHALGEGIETGIGIHTHTPVVHHH